MPTTLPVPSKGALRTLRHLALGTSCTLAISAGLLTEDRRRRIHAAREVHDNAKKLKASRNYHSNGTVALESFEEQAIRYQDDAYWLPSNVARGKKTRSLVRTEDSVQPDIHNSDQLAIFLPPAESDITWKSFRPVPAIPAIRIPKSKPAGIPKHAQNNRQHRLANDVSRLLEDDSADLEAATSRFLDAMEEGLVDDGSALSQRLIDISVRLFDVCKQQPDKRLSEKIFDAVFALGPLTEEDYYRFDPHAIIMRLLEHPKSGDSADPQNLKKALSIYLPTFKEKRKILSESMQSLGGKLCKEAYMAGLYDDCVKVCFLLSTHGHDASPITTQYLLKATHQKGDHKRMFRYFKNFYIKIKPRSGDGQFIQIVHLVLDSVLKLGQFDKAEEVLVTAVPLAKSAGIPFSTTCLLKVLGHHWRTHRDIVQTQILFNRLELLSKSASHPQALYVAMIQFCVEAEEEARAQAIFDKMQSLYHVSPKDLRVYGHFALAKAMRQDWVGVRANLIQMRDCNPEDGDTFRDCFTPILRCHLNSHSILQTEEFIRSYVEDCQLKLTPFVMNLMTNAYAKAKETDSIIRWVGYAASQGVVMDSVTFNTLLNNLHQTWGFSFGEIVKFYEKLRSIEGLSFILMDEDTVRLLRRLAPLNCSNEEKVAARLQTLKALDLPKHKLDSDSVYVSMATTFGKGNAKATLSIYKHAQSQQIILKPQHLLLAVRASLQIRKEPPEEATHLIQSAQQKGLDVSLSVAAVFIDQLKQVANSAENDPERIRSLASTTVALFVDSGINVPQSVMTHTAAVLHKKGHHRQAIEFCNVMSRRLNLPPSSFDIATFTILCKAYAAILDTKGIRWIIEMIRASNITPDTAFRDMLKETQRQTLRSLERRACSDKMRCFLECILDARQEVREMRAASVSAKKDIRLKTLQIMEQAVHEQILHARPSKIIDENPLKMLEKEFEFEESYSMNSLGKDTEDTWLGTNLDPVVELVIPARMAGSVAG
jgi:hypothetical protein